MKEKIKRFFKKIGPGFITGAADDDPSGIATYIQTGISFGYNQLWTALFSFPFMSVIQEMCGRIGLVTGKGLSGVIKKHYNQSILFFAVTLLLIANIINIGADLGAMAVSAKLVINLPFAFWLIVLTAITLFLEVYVTYSVYAKFLKYLTLSLFAYIIVAFVVKQDWSKIFLSTLIPTFSLSREYLLNIVAILGTTISPYLFFWEADEEVEEEIVHHKIKTMGKGIPKIRKSDVLAMKSDTIFGMFFSNLVTFFIIITAASTLRSQNILGIVTADKAALALRPIAGDFAYLLFAFGIIGVGLLAIPILAGSASYAISEVFGWNAGLSLKLKKAQGFYGVIICSTLLGLLVNFIGIKPFQMLYYTAVLNGIIAPPLMILIVLISNNKNIMGRYTNSKTSNMMGWFITGIMTLAVLALLINL
jgi:NRAMP (natural resistance-associated macrophage protein)-like metal ion transporter